MMSLSSAPKIAFMVDDRLSHDRKTIFTRTMTILKAKMNMDFLSSSLTEAEVIDELKSNSYTLILLPWYKYTTWKKLEAHLGALRMNGPTVAGYFADAILPFEFSKMPNFNRMILLDLYRFDQNEIESMIEALSEEGKKAGLTSFLEKNTQIFHTHWFNQDHHTTRCVDAAMNIPLLKSTHWHPRSASLRIYLTALWTLCFRERHSLQSTEPCGELEISEFNKRLVVKLVFESHELTLKHMMDYFWPNDSGEKDGTVRELVRHSDFIRVHHFPESHQVEILAFFTPSAPSIHFPSEVRGFWVEPMKTKYLKLTEGAPGKRIPIHQAKRALVSERVHEVLEALRSVHHQLANATAEERLMLESQVSHIHFLVSEIEKKLAEKKKAA
jgi:hypothetical protein